MHVHYLEIVTPDVDAVCATYACFTLCFRSLGVVVHRRYTTHLSGMGQQCRHPVGP